MWNPGRAVGVRGSGSMRVVMWGTYDRGKPRNRILLQGLRANGVEVIECHASVWAGIEDKSQVAGINARLRRLLSWVSSYPRLIVRYLRLAPHDVVLVGYLGQLDVLVLWPFARLRSARVVWDAFLSLHDTVVEDRRLIGARHPFAIALFVWEWIACRAADLVLLDTRAHAAYFSERFGLAPERVCAVFVGAETDRFFPAVGAPARDAPHSELRVLFYGQFIPLHGIETIVRAMRLARDENLHWTLIGRGQEAARIGSMLEEQPLERVEWIEWVPYEELAGHIRRADVCLGIFGAGGKAGRVIPNKVFQILAAGAPLVTRDSPAIRELFEGTESEGVILVRPEDPKALLDGVRALGVRSQRTLLHRDLLGSIGPEGIGRRLIERLWPGVSV